MRTAEGSLPVLVSIPHASSAVPPEMVSLLALGPEELLHYTDIATDQIFAIPDTYRVEAEVSRVIVDVNRAPDDLSREYEQAEEGVMVHTTWDGRKVYRTEPHADTGQRLIDTYHDAYHAQIDEFIPRVQFLFDGHSFLPVGPMLKRDSGEERPDINIGNVNYSTCSREQTVFVRDFFEGRGYRVRINFPYAGKYILGHHCHRRRIPGFLVPGLQIEINQGLYVKPDSVEPVPARVEEFRGLMGDLVSVFAEKFCALEGVGGRA